MVGFAGVAWREDPGKQFAWHPILLTLAIVLSKYNIKFSIVILGVSDFRIFFTALALKKFEDF